jgi:hypothetical protein
MFERTRQGEDGVILEKTTQKRDLVFLYVSKRKEKEKQREENKLMAQF